MGQALCHSQPQSTPEEEPKEDVGPLSAVCMVNEDGNSGVSGVVEFYQESPNAPCEIKGSFQGLTKGKHGFHIHEFGDLREGCTTAGGHFNPFGRTHGGPEDEVRHVGDLGNVKARRDGVAKVDIEDEMITLYGPHSIIGRSVVVHADEDDLGKGGHKDSLTTGHAGARVACGVIGLAK